jgi:hypothetical protein
VKENQIKSDYCVPCFSLHECHVKRAFRDEADTHGMDTICSNRGHIYKHQCLQNNHCMSCCTKGTRPVMRHRPVRRSHATSGQATRTPRINTNGHPHTFSPRLLNRPSTFTQPQLLKQKTDRASSHSSFLPVLVLQQTPLFRPPPHAPLSRAR